MCVFRGPLLVLAAASVFFAHGVANDIAEKELSDIQEYMDTLDFLLKEEYSHTSDVTTNFRLPEVEAEESVCLAVEHPLEIGDNYDTVIYKTLSLWNKCLALWKSKLAYANWNYETNLTTYNEQQLGKVHTEMEAWSKTLSSAAHQYKGDLRYEQLDFSSKRQLRLLSYSTTAANPDDTEKLINVSNKLVNTYSTAKVAGLSLEPNLTKQMAEGRDPNLLLAAWYGWRQATGPKMKDDYEKMVDLLNKGARDNGYDDYVEAWLQSQFDETDDVEKLSEDLWEEMKPLYQELHAYVRHKLMMKYKNSNREFQNLDSIFQSGGIPAHLTGNMWAQDWSNIYEIVRPFDLPEPDYDQTLKDNGYDVNKLFTTAEDFYKSIGLDPMTEKFKTFSMKERPKDGREVVCHASASDFYNDDDFRIKMCTEINMDMFETIHHEMGHIEYFMAYKDQPAVYRDGANSAFHEAIGDTVSLSVLTQQHLQTLGLAPAGAQKGVGKGMDITKKREINYLMRKALFKIAFVPFGYLIDKWRWEVMRGDVTKDGYNKRWWDLRLEYQGLVAPVPRSERDFDPGAKFHIPVNSPYICYFISFIVQFQFYEAMCKAANHTDPLHTCDFFNSKEAGFKLLDMLKLGKSLPWKDAMERLTGTREVSTKAIRTYFKPLYTWLKKENGKNRMHPGWEYAKINWEDDPY